MIQLITYAVALYVKVQLCKVVQFQIGSHCGMHHHLSAVRVLVNDETVHVSTQACRDMFIYKKFRPSGLDAGYDLEVILLFSTVPTFVDVHLWYPGFRSVKQLMSHIIELVGMIPKAIA
jgi:hypothetical protein